jgi:peptide chain release factor 2
MRDFTTDIRDVSQRLKDASAYLRIDALRVRIAELEIEISKPDLWDDQERAKQVNTEYSNVKGDIDEYESLARAVEDVEVLHELAREEDDSSQEPDIEAGLDVVSRRLSVLEMRSLFTGEHDESDAIVQVNAKDGGVDAQDWTEILLRMYSRWAERRGFTTSTM